MKTQKLLLFLMEIYIDYLFLYVSNISREQQNKKNISNLRCFGYVLIKIRTPQNLGCIFIYKWKCTSNKVFECLCISSTYSNGAHISICSSYSICKKQLLSVLRQSRKYVHKRRYVVHFIMLYWSENIYLANVKIDAVYSCIKTVCSYVCTIRSQ